MADNTLAVEHVTEFARRRNSLKRRIDLGIAVIGIGDLKTALGVARNTITAEIQFAFFEGHVLTDEAITQIALVNFQIHAHRVEHGFVKLGKVVHNATAFASGGVDFNYFAVKGGCNFVCHFIVGFSGDYSRDL